MGILNWKTEEYHREKITKALKVRGLIPDSTTWEVHGPHEGMNYQVYVGYATDKDNPNDTYCLVFWPGRGVWEIDDPSDWWKKGEKTRRITI